MAIAMSTDPEPASFPSEARHIVGFLFLASIFVRFALLPSPHMATQRRLVHEPELARHKEAVEKIAL